MNTSNTQIIIEDLSSYKYILIQDNYIYLELKENIVEQQNEPIPEHNEPFISQQNELIVPEQNEQTPREITTHNITLNNLSLFHKLMMVKLATKKYKVRENHIIACFINNENLIKLIEDQNGSVKDAKNDYAKILRYLYEKIGDYHKIKDIIGSRDNSIKESSLQTEDHFNQKLNLYIRGENSITVLRKIFKCIWHLRYSIQLTINLEGEEVCFRKD